jgi:hypothetical protein
MKLEQALDLPFNEYMRWCREDLEERRRRDPLTNITIGRDSTSQLFLEASWGRRYWFHLVEKKAPAQTPAPDADVPAGSRDNDSVAA